MTNRVVISLRAIEATVWLSAQGRAVYAFRLKDDGALTVNDLQLLYEQIRAELRLQGVGGF